MNLRTPYRCSFFLFITVASCTSDPEIGSALDTKEVTPTDQGSGGNGPGPVGTPVATPNPPNPSTPDASTPDSSTPEAASPVNPPSNTPAGCVNGLLVDPKAYFFWLINRTEGAPATGWEAVLAASGMPDGPGPGQHSDPTKTYGIAQQIGGGGPRGRIFLPTDTPDPLGYYTHPIDVLKDGPTPGQLLWAWRDWLGGPPYAPRPCP